MKKILIKILVVLSVSLLTLYYADVADAIFAMTILGSILFVIDSRVVAFFAFVTLLISQILAFLSILGTAEILAKFVFVLLVAMLIRLVDELKLKKDDNLYESTL